MANADDSKPPEDEQDDARLWIAVASLSHPAGSDAERLEAVLSLIAKLERGSATEIAREAAPAVLGAARGADPEDSCHLARYAVILLERLRAVEALSELVGDSTLAAALRRRAGGALIRAGGEPALARIERITIIENSREGGDLGLAADLDLALALSREPSAAPTACGPFLFPRACPACFGDLLHLGSLDLADAGPDAEVRRLSLWRCRACGSGIQGDSARAPRFLFEEVASAWFPTLLGLFDACPRPHDTGCDCAAHQNLGVTG